MPATLPRYAFGPIVLDPAERLLLRDGRSVALPPKAFDVLTVLVAHAGRLVTKDELLAVWWPGVVVAENVLSVTVSRLRAALGAEGRVRRRRAGPRLRRAWWRVCAVEPDADRVEGPPL